MCLLLSATPGRVPVGLNTWYPQQLMVAFFGAAVQTLLSVYACMGLWSAMRVTFRSDTGSGLDVNCCVGKAILCVSLNLKHSPLIRLNQSSRPLRPAVLGQTRPSYSLTQSLTRTISNRHISYTILLLYMLAQYSLSHTHLLHS
jgi:hypothetical protein